jgi:hypothetical protein
LYTKPEANISIIKNNFQQASLILIGSVNQKTCHIKNRLFNGKQKQDKIHSIPAG